MVKTSFNTVYEGYAYSYPHKHSYRRLQPMALQDLWTDEKKDALFLYLHLPFCEMRCGFCNLFTIANPQGDVVDHYLQTLAREAAAVKELIAPESFGQMAVGGGTPTFLSLPQLETLFHIIRDLGGDPAAMPTSFETSPATITREKLAFLAQQGVDRVSMGVQSFVDAEVKALGRPQQNKAVYAALDLLLQQDFGTVNIDLIYGAYGQTLSFWLHSVQEVVRLGIPEVFMYPLYVRPLTGITKMEQGAEDHRFLFYREAKALLLSEGYQQVSMRLFRKVRPAHKHPARVYSCQEDGMIGLGAGARSYTRAVHYSSEYAVARQHIRSIIDQYIARPAFDTVDYGIQLDQEEQQRRFVIKSILHGSGLDTARYRALYGHDVLAAYPLLQDLLAQDLAYTEQGVLRLASEGLDYSDAIGPRLYSTAIQQRINTFELL